VDDITGLTDGTDEKFCGFKDRGSDFFETAGFEKDAGFFLDPLPLFNFSGEEIVHAGETLVFRCHSPNTFQFLRSRNWGNPSCLILIIKKPKAGIGLS